MRLSLFLLLAVLIAPGLALADSAPFDLAGPVLTVSVTRQRATLPISEVPNLAVGDQLAIKAEWPQGQSAHYLLVAAFLRGATNPPPPIWFYQAETWSRKGRGGLNITVPAGAQQAIVFLAPQTGGDFATLVNAVRGRPGAFVRASQDLNQASLDRARLDTFLTAVRKQDPSSDPDRLKTISPLLARSLTIKLNTDCFDKAPELQASCLMQGRDALVLNDGHSASIVDALTTGPATDLASQLSATPQAGFGYYSPYIGAVTDIARIMESFRTAQYQYIPALSTLRDDKVVLWLNTSPSFHNPLSVLVAALPAVASSQAPPLQPVDPKAGYCAERPDLVLPIEGAPLAYATRYAHDMALRVKTREGQTVDLPVTADAEKGGFIVDTKPFDPAAFSPSISGVLHGAWGFEPFDGPTFHLQIGRSASWRLADEDVQALVVGRDDTVRLDGESAACVVSVALQTPLSEQRPLDWKVAQADRVTVTVPLADAQPGDVNLLIKVYGAKEPSVVPLRAFSQVSRLESFALHVGDHTGELKGKRLDEVVSLTVAGVSFKPDILTTAGGVDRLSMVAADAGGLGKLQIGQTVLAKVALKDGRTVSLKTPITAPRPSVALIGKSAQPPSIKPPIAIELTNSDELAHGAQLTFSIRAQRPAAFTGREAIEVTTLDGGATATLTAENGLTLADPQVAVATLDTGKAFGASGFGPLRFRIVEEGDAGEWQPLATLVRLPVLQELNCHEGPARPCMLAGSELFLIESVASDPGFAHAVQVPEGFPGYAMAVPHPVAGRLYLKLHDDPQVINLVAFPPRRLQTAP